ncbi:MAG TPA: hypothetical protein DIW61_15780 [Candidatus Aminicenantes bacterium]|nr:hypothetical protein [Candidatus Aminicenantes bacterium]
MFKKERPILPRLSFPTRMIGSGTAAIEEYVIPDEEKDRVLEDMYPFEPVPKLTDMMFDLHEERPFQVQEYRVIRGKSMDYLVSPYFFNSGGTVMDWMPPDFKPGETLSRRIRGSSVSVLTVSMGPRATCH